MSKVITEEEARKLLKVDDFRHLSKDKVISFMSLIPDMDKDVAIKCIEQFPDFKNYGLDMFGKLNEGYQKIIDSGKESAKETMSAYRLVLDTMKEIIDKDDLTFDEKRQVAADMVMVADKISEQDKGWKDFLSKFAQGLGVAAVAGVAIGAAIVGVKVDNNKLLK